MKDDLTTAPLPDGQVRIWEPEAHANDLGRMYVLDVFGVSLMIREREDGLYIHIDRDGESDTPKSVESASLFVEVSNSGEAEFEFEAPCAHANQHVNDRSQFVCDDCGEELGR